MKTNRESLEDEIEKYATMRASLTLRWWRAHHYRKEEELREFLIKDMAIKERLPEEKMEEAIDYLIKAAEYHNLAEQEGIPEEKERDYWNLAEKELIKYYVKIETLKEG